MELTGRKLLSAPLNVFAFAYAHLDSIGVWAATLFSGIPLRLHL
jgi:hypothetical protein